MESFLEFEPLTPQLSSIGVPTMILNGEFDFLTPRHETLRIHIPNSSLVIIPKCYHAFTLEKPALTATCWRALLRTFWPAVGAATRPFGSHRRTPAANSFGFPRATIICALSPCREKRHERIFWTARR